MIGSASLFKTSKCFSLSLIFSLISCLFNCYIIVIESLYNCYVLYYWNFNSDTWCAYGQPSPKGVIDLIPEWGHLGLKSCGQSSLKGFKYELISYNKIINSS